MILTNPIKTATVEQAIELCKNGDYFVDGIPMSLMAEESVKEQLNGRILEDRQTGKSRLIVTEDSQLIVLESDFDLSSMTIQSGNEVNSSMLKQLNAFSSPSINVSERNPMRDKVLGILANVKASEIPSEEEANKLSADLVDSNFNSFVELGIVPTSATLGIVQKNIEFISAERLYKESMSTE